MGIQRNNTAGSSLTVALGGAPAAGDGVVIHSMNNGNAPTYSTGNDISTNEIDTFSATQTWRGQLGTASAHVVLDLSGSSYTGLLTYDCPDAGDAYIEAKTDIQKAVIVSTGRGTYYACGGTYTALELTGGDLEVSGSAVLVSGTFLGGEAVVYDNATAVTSLTAKNMSRLRLERQVTSATIVGCKEASFDSYSDAIVTLILEDTAFRYNGGTITNHTGKDGSVLDLRGVVQDIAITNSTLHPGALILYPKGFTVTHTNAPTLVGGGPDWWQ